MTIGVRKLVEGQWYDGFVFDKGKQRGVATMMWAEGRFHPGVIMHADAPSAHWGLTFEPNVQGVNPDAKNKNPRATAKGYAGSGRKERGTSPLSGDGTLGSKAPVSTNRCCKCKEK